jgi:hypothetical protein
VPAASTSTSRAIWPRPSPSSKGLTAVASLIPGSDQVEIDVSTDLSGENPPTGDASQLLGSLPADSSAAFASADFGDRFEEAIDQIDTNGIPGQIPAGKFKSTLKEAGIDLEKIAASVGDLGVFATGTSESSVGGAVVLATKGSKERPIRFPTSACCYVPLAPPA